MKKILFVMSILAFVLATVSCFVYSPVVGIWVGLISAVLICADWYLVKNDARLWTIVAIFILALILSFFAGTRVGKIRSDIRHIEYEEATEEATLSEEDEVKEFVEVEADNGEHNSKDTVTTTQEPIIIEKQVIVEKIVEVPVEEVIEVPAQVEQETTNQVATDNMTPNSTTPQTSVPTTTTPTPNYNNVYYGDPTGNNYNNGYYGDPTGANYGNYNNGYNYGYGNGYYGDPTGSYNNNNNSNNSSIRISGDKTVTAGETVTYTISGVSKVKESKLDLPANVTVQDISGNKVELYFEDGWTGAYSIGYDSAVINVRVTAE